MNMETGLKYLFLLPSLNSKETKPGLAKIKNKLLKNLLSK